MTNIQNEMEAALLRHIEALRMAKEAIQDEDGNPPPGLTAATDQFTSEAKELLNIFVQHAQEHRSNSAKERCCRQDPLCVGMEVMLAVAASAEVTLSHLLMAFVAAIGKLANLPPEEKGDPHDGA